MLSRDSMFSLKLRPLALVCALMICAVGLCLLSRSRATERGRDSQSLRTLIEQEEKHVLNHLQSRLIWQDASKDKEVAECLEVVTKLRLASLVTVLVNHIDYEPHALERKTAFLALESRFPVMVSLKHIGIPAVPGLVTLLKTADVRPGKPKIREPEDALKYLDVSPRSAQRGYLAVECLFGIYEQGENGRELARKRIELELTKSVDDQTRANLRAALGHPIFMELNSKDAQKCDPH